MNTPIQTLPGVSTLATLQTRHLFTDTATRQAIAANAVLAGSLSRDVANAADPAQLRAGLVMGKTAATGKYRPSIIGVTAANISAATVTSITVPAAVATEVARLIAVAGGNVALKLIGPPTAGGTVATTTVTATAASNTTLTVSSVAIPAYVAGTIVAPADGAEAPITFIPEGYGQPVQDGNGGSVDHLLSPFYNAGDVNVGQVVNYASLDASTKAWLKQQLRTVADFTFSDDR